MTGLDVFKSTVATDNADEHRDVAAHLGVQAEEAIEIVKHFHRIGAHGEA